MQRGDRDQALVGEPRAQGPTLRRGAEDVRSAPHLHVGVRGALAAADDVHREQPLRAADVHLEDPLRGRRRDAKDVGVEVQLHAHAVRHHEAVGQLLLDGPQDLGLDDAEVEQAAACALEVQVQLRRVEEEHAEPLEHGRARDEVHHLDQQVAPDVEVLDADRDAQRRDEADVAVRLPVHAAPQHQVLDGALGRVLPLLRGGHPEELRGPVAERAAVPVEVQAPERIRQGGLHRRLHLLLQHSGDVGGDGRPHVLQHAVQGLRERVARDVARRRVRRLPSQQPRLRGDGGDG
mmetsp:Transcript_17244/g.51678  ORF Transcript_17244/g.51678 Transcript_17244/m.51678 type:complete len:292 (+) Transcript_17244:1137-2012(+)